MTTPLQILRDARKLIAVPDRWTQGESARTSAGKPTRPRSTKAACWCLLGAIDWAAFDQSPEVHTDDGSFFVAETALSEACGGAISVFNDAPERTHAEVLAAMDAAIASLEQEAAR